MPEFNQFKIANGITFFSNPNLVGRKFNDFEVYFLIKRTSKNMILAKMIAALFDYEPVTYLQMTNDVLRDMYNASVNIDCNVCEDKIYIKVHISVINDKYTFESDENLCESAIKFLCDTILYADVKERDVYYQILQNLKNEIESDEEDKENYLKRAFEEVFPDTFVAVNSMNSLYELDNISYNSFANFYRHLLRTANILIFGYGEYDEKMVTDYFKSHFKEIKRRKPIVFDSAFDFKGFQSQEIQSVYKNGIANNLTVIYRLDRFYEFEKHTALLYLYIILLREVLFNVVREKNGLVYDISVTGYSRYPMLAVHGNIYKSDYDKILSYIKSTDLLALSIYDERMLSEKLEIAKNKIKLAIDYCYRGGSFWYIVYMYQDMLNIEDINNITVSDIKNFANYISEASKNFTGVYFES